MADVIEITGPGGAVEQRWDDGPRLYTDFRPNPDFVRAYTVAENADADERTAVALVASNEAQLADPTTLAGRLTRLAAYETDPEIVAALARANNTAPTTQELNRLLKVMLRRDERQTAAIAALVRLVDPSLLADISDTADS